MKVLLRSDIKGIGRRGDIVNVSSGHARNFLLPNDLAIVANAGTIAQAEVMRKSREQQIAADRESARLVASSLSTTVIKIAARLVTKVVCSGQSMLPKLQKQFLTKLV